jgi:hypothetical protein
MRLERTLSRIRAGERRAGRDVGHAMVKRDREELTRFRAEVCSVDPEGAYAEGYRDALLDVVAAFSAGWEALSARWPVGWEDAYDCLAMGGQTPTEVAACLGVSLATASRRLAAMADHGLLVISDSTDGRMKVYSRAPGKGEQHGVQT